MRWMAALALALACVLAHAHAVVLSSQPAIGATLKESAVSVELRFNSRIDSRHSRLQLIGPDGSASDLAVQTVASPDVLAASARALRPGGYRLRWQVMSLDGHITRGDIPFSLTR
jgi:methionine-rich copper-binding protein CopC